MTVILTGYNNSAGSILVGGGAATPPAANPLLSEFLVNENLDDSAGSYPMTLQSGSPAAYRGNQVVEGTTSIFIDETKPSLVGTERYPATPAGLTIDLYARPKARAGGLCSKWITAADQRSWALYLNGSRGALFGLSTDGTDQPANILESTTTAGISVFTRFTCVWSPGAYQRIYFDQVLVGEKTTGVPPAIFDSTAPLMIGSYAATEDVNFHPSSHIDAIRIYNEAVLPWTL